MIFLGTLLIKNGRVFDGLRFIEGDLLIRDGILAAIGKVPVSADRVFDAAGMTVLPGLVDVHLHMQGVSSPAWWIDPAVGCHRFGVTAAADASASRGDRPLLDTFPVENGVFVIVGTKEPVDFTIAQERLDRYGDRVLGIKVIYDQKANPALEDEKILERICAFARRRQLPVLVHVANSPVSLERIFRCLSAGDIATHVFCGGTFNAALDDFACLKNAQARGIYLDSCICGGEHVDLTLYAEAIRAGVYPDLMGTDLAQEIASRSGGYGLTVCMTLARVLGMPEEHIFRAVTGNAGKALNRPWGLLREGKPADLAVLEWTDAPMELSDRRGNQVTSKESYRCRLTVKAGKILYEG